MDCLFRVKTVTLETANVTNCHVIATDILFLSSNQRSVQFLYLAASCYFLVSSYRSSLFTLSKCNLSSISSFLIFPPAAEHTLQRNMKENSRRGLKTNTKGSACLQEEAWKL